MLRKKGLWPPAGPPKTAIGVNNLQQKNKWPKKKNKISVIHYINKINEITHGYIRKY